jgi:uncharacterized coiled-coil DUF342 family protein
LAAIAGFALILWQQGRSTRQEFSAKLEGVKSEVTGLRTELKADIADVRGEVRELRNEVRELRRDIADTNKRIDFVTDRVWLRDNHSGVVATAHA